MVQLQRNRHRHQSERRAGDERQPREIALAGPFQPQEPAEEHDRHQAEHDRHHADDRLESAGLERLPAREERHHRRAERHEPGFPALTISRTGDQRIGAEDRVQRPREREQLPPFDAEVVAELPSEHRGPRRNQDACGGLRPARRGNEREQDGDAGHV